MSKNSCVWTPGINKDLSGEPSALHSDLVEYTGDRPISNVIWSLTKVDGALDKSNLELDENGEPTLSSLNEVLPIRDIVKSTSLSVEKRDVGAIDEKDNPIAYDSLGDALGMIDDFNEQNPDLIAYPYESNKKFFINVEYKNESNYQKLQEATFNDELNTSLLGILKSLGFTAIYDENVSGVFDPMNAMNTANGLKAVIRISKGKLGREAFPEEFSHCMIEGLQDHPLVQRILNSLKSEEAIRQVLGEEYDKYVALYTENGRLDNLRMQKEAAGKMLQRYITTGEVIESPAPEGLFTRLWNFIKGLFSNISEEDIDKAINTANRNTAQLASMIKDESILPYFNKSKVLDAKILYNISEEVNKAQSIAEAGLEVASRRLKLMQARSKDDYNDKDAIRNLKNMQNLIESKKYAASSLAFLQDTLKSLASLQRRLKALERRKDRLDASDMGALREGAKTLRMIKEFADGYVDVVEAMESMPSLLKRGEVDITESDAENIAEHAGKVLTIIRQLKRNYAELRYRVVYEFLKVYWGEDKVWHLGKNKGQQLTLAHILTTLDKDINGMDRWISSMSDASDPLLSLIDKAVKTARASRDIQLEEIIAKIRGIHKALKDAGETSEFMYELDENGKKTGRIISNINYAQYYKDRREYYESLKKEGLKPYKIKAKMDTWENNHTVSVDGKIMPKGLEKGDMYYIDRLSKLTSAQRQYYDAMMKIKMTLDDKLPSRYVRTYNAVQVRNDLIEGISQSDNPKAAIKMILGNMADNFVRRSDDIDWGEKVEGEESKGKEKNVSLDFSGNLMNKLPIYYTRPLEDMDRLSTDFTGSLMTYASMAIDYHEMNRIIDLLELTRDLVHDRDVQQLSGDKKIVETFKVLNKEFSHSYTIKGGKAAERVDDYYDSVIYSKKKRNEVVSILGRSFDVTKMIDTVKSYTGALGLGLNVFSAMSNVTVGKMQIFIEAISGQYFGYKNSIVGKKHYYALLPKYLGELNSTSKSSKLGLLIDKYDALEEFYESLRMQGKFKGPVSRIMQGANLFILNNMGEHYLHSRTMLAMLDRYKVNIKGKETSLYDAWKVKTIKDKKGNPVSSMLVLEDGTTTTKGEELFTEKHVDELNALREIKSSDRTQQQQDRIEELLDLKEKTDAINTNIRFKIGKVNQSLNGAFNEADRGAWQRYALGRLAMQFRQWMPAHYSRRFASAYYDALLEEQREGYYITLGRFTLNLMKDLRHAKFQFFTNYKSLSQEEKANMRRAFAEIGAFAVLAALCSMCGHWKDRKHNWGERLVLYNMERMKLETGASIPWPISTQFISNIWTLIQSPAASMKTFQLITELLSFQNMFNEIESGRYKGWTEYERNLVLLAPIYGQIRKVFDLSTENYMFNIYNK